MKKFPKARLKTEKRMEAKEGIERVEGIGVVNVVLVECKRCGHNWIPRVPVVRICPRCKSPYWNVEKTRFFNNSSNNHSNNHKSKDSKSKKRKDGKRGE